MQCFSVDARQNVHRAAVSGQPDALLYGSNGPRPCTGVGVVSFRRDEHMGLPGYEKQDADTNGKKDCYSGSSRDHNGTV